MCELVILPCPALPCTALPCPARQGVERKFNIDRYYAGSTFNALRDLFHLLKTCHVLTVDAKVVTICSAATGAVRILLSLACHVRAPVAPYNKSFDMTWIAWPLPPGPSLSTTGEVQV